MKPRVLSVLLLFFGFWNIRAAVADNRFIVRDPAGFASLGRLCSVLGCHLVGGLDGSLGALFLVTTPDQLDPNLFLQILRLQPQIQNAELDLLLEVMQATAAKREGLAGIQPKAPSGLWDRTPVDYFGVSVWQGYVSQPASTIIRISETQAAFGVSGSGTVAVIDTGVDPTQPVLRDVLVPGYDFTRGISGSGSELADIDRDESPISSEASPARVNQSTMAVVDQDSAGELQQPQYRAFGHGTMVAGIIHLVAPTAFIMPLKAFRADGSGYLSDVLSATYFAVQNGAKVINMSFSLSTYSRELARATKFASAHEVICVASAGNDASEELVYPAAYADVMGVASTSNRDTLSTFSNYGEELVWVGAPGEGIITTYPFATYAAGWGTSFSAPFVSGGAALLVGVSGDCNQDCAERSLANAVWISPDLGNGRVDLYQAVTSLESPN